MFDARVNVWILLLLGGAREHKGKSLVLKSFFTTNGNIHKISEQNYASLGKV
jgi:hypothetical protein